MPPDRKPHTPTPKDCGSCTYRVTRVGVTPAPLDTTTGEIFDPLSGQLAAILVPKEGENLEGQRGFRCDISAICDKAGTPACGNDLPAEGLQTVQYIGAKSSVSDTEVRTSATAAAVSMNARARQMCENNKPQPPHTPKPRRHLN